MAATVEFDEGSVPAGAQLVKGARDEFLARAGFAANEHCGTGGGNGLDILEHQTERGALTDDLVENCVRSGFSSSR